MMSRYARAQWVYPSPLDKPVDFMDSITNAINQYRPSLIMPVVESTLIVLNKHRAAIELNTALATASYESVELSLNKQQQFSLAAQHGIPIPKTVCPSSLDEAFAATDRMEFPLVIKPSVKPWGAGSSWSGFKVSFIHSRTELEEILTRYYQHHVVPVVQEITFGEGIGCGVIMDRGKALACYQYHRGRELPFTGGVPVRYESMPLWSHVRDHSERLLRAMGWQGVAQVEWKVRPGSQDIALMEVNGRFWASLTGSIHAGMDFPYWSYQLHSGKPDNIRGTYQQKIASRFLRGDLIRLESVLRRQDALSSVPVKSPWQELLYFIVDFFRWNVRSDIFSWDDFRPGIREGSTLIREYTHRLTSKLFGQHHLKKSLR